MSLSLQDWVDMSVTKRLEQVVESKEDGVLEDMLRSRVLPMMYQQESTSTSDWYVVFEREARVFLIILSLEHHCNRSLVSLHTQEL